MLGRKLLAFAVLLILVSGCTLPGETRAGEETQGEEKEYKPPIRQVDKTVAIVDESMQEPEEAPEEIPLNETGAVEGNETTQEEVAAGNETASGEEAPPEETPPGEEPGETEPEAEPEEEPEEEEPEEGGNETGIKLVEFQPAALLLECNGECTRHRVYDGENEVVIAAINQSRLLMAKEKEYFLLYSNGCNASGLKDSFEISGKQYWFNYPAAFKRDWADFAEFQGTESGFSLHEGEMEKFNGERAFLWRIVPGASVCDAYLEISIFEEVVFLEGWMEGVVLGLEEQDGELELEYLMYPEDTLK